MCVRSAGRKFAALCNFHNERESDKRGPVASRTLLQKQQFNFLRVFARKSIVVYCRGCRRPESDFDETRTRGAAGPKTKSGGPLLAGSADTAGLGAAKVAIFGL